MSNYLEFSFAGNFGEGQVYEGLHMCVEAREYLTFHFSTHVWKSESHTISLYIRVEAREHLTCRHSVALPLSNPALARSQTNSFY